MIQIIGAELKMKGLNQKIQTGVVLFSGILFWLLIAHPARNIPSMPADSVLPILIELQGDIPKPGAYLIDSEKATISNALAAAGWSGIAPGSSAGRRLSPGQAVILRNRGGDPEITISWMPGAARLAAGQKLDLNTASVEDLLLIPKMRAGMAASIVRRREAKAWVRVGDLRQIRGIGPKTALVFEQYLEVVPAK